MRHVLLVLALALVLVLSGCGEDDPNGGGGAPSTQAGAATAEAGGETIGADDWARRVTTLCGENRRRAQRLVRDIQADAQRERLPEYEVAARVLEESVDTTRPLLEEMEALPAPRGRERQATRFLELLRQTLPYFERNARALRAKDADEIDRISDRVLEIAGESRRLARELDIEACIPDDS